MTGIYRNVTHISEALNLKINASFKYILMVKILIKISVILIIYIVNRHACKRVSVDVTGSPDRSVLKPGTTYIKIQVNLNNQLSI